MSDIVNVSISRARAYLEREEIYHVSAANVMAVGLDVAWKKLCEDEMMIFSFVDVGLSPNEDDSEYHRMKFQRQELRKPPDFNY